MNNVVTGGIAIIALGLGITIGRLEKTVDNPQASLGAAQLLEERVGETRPFQFNPSGYTLNKGQPLTTELLGPGTSLEIEYVGADEHNNPLVNIDGTTYPLSSNTSLQLPNLLDSNRTVYAYIGSQVPDKGEPIQIMVFFTDRYGDVRH